MASGIPSDLLLLGNLLHNARLDFPPQLHPPQEKNNGMPSTGAQCLLRKPLPLVLLAYE